ncbi:3'-5'-exoribonuclease family protein [Tasmannia lanceolata]|uniref:3'-5'-exoribonuclease family protein n=1 Tax=Tasmannia lanceolata TaxID=3420 RepID=UPI0040629B59
MISPPERINSPTVTLRWRKCHFPFFLGNNISSTPYFNNCTSSSCLLFYKEHSKDNLCRANLKRKDNSSLCNYEYMLVLISFPASRPLPFPLFLSLLLSQTHRTLTLIAFLKLHRRIIEERMDSTSGDLSGEMEVDAYRRLFPLRFYERHLKESVRPDARPLGQARDTTVALGAVASADGSAMVKIGCTTMLAGIKLEVMTPSLESPDEGCIAIEFHMPPICSPIVRPGRPAEVVPVISKQLSDVISSSEMVNLKELSLVSGKAAWMAYLDIYCLDADGSLFDAALLSAVAALSHLQIPLVSLNDDGRVVTVSGEGKSVKEVVNKERRKLTLTNIPYSLTCILHKKYILVDPTAEEESIMESLVTVVLDSSGCLVSLYKPGGSVLAYESTIQDCVALTRRRVKELQKIVDEAHLEMEID